MVKCKKCKKPIHVGQSTVLRNGKEKYHEKRSCFGKEEDGDDVGTVRHVTGNFVSQGMAIYWSLRQEYLKKRRIQLRHKRKHLALTKAKKLSVLRKLNDKDGTYLRRKR